MSTDIAGSQLLGCILAGTYSDQIMGQAINAGVTDAWWQDSRHRKIWGLLCDLYAEGRPCHVQEMAIASSKEQELSMMYLCSLVDMAPSGSDATRLITHLKNDYILRRAMFATLTAQDIIENASTDTAVESVAKAQDAIMSINTEHEVDIHPADAAVEQITEWQTVDISNRSGLHWFVHEVDAVVGPLTDELVYINSLPSVGKTAYALNMIVHAARRNIRASFVSLESARNKIAQRLTTIVSGINANGLKFQRVPQGKYESAREAMKEFKKCPSGWTFTARTIEQIYAWARMEIKKGTRAIIIDNMKHIRTHSELSSTAEQFRELSLRLKQLRDSLGIPIIMLHHLNKQMQASWSSDIERDADIICNLENQDNDLAATTRRVSMVCIKNRDGLTGDIPLLFDKSTQSFKAEKQTGKDLPE